MAMPSRAPAITRALTGSMPALAVFRARRLVAVVAIRPPPCHFLAGFLGQPPASPAVLSKRPTRRAHGGAVHLEYDCGAVERGTRRQPRPFAVGGRVSAHH